MFAHGSAWDTEADAREFFDAYVKRTQLRYADAKAVEQPNSEDQTRNSKPQTRNFYSWQTNEGQVVMEQRGLRVTILEGLPQQTAVNDFLRGLRF
jgi:hypothetical protein